MTRLNHPHIVPTLTISVPEGEAASYVRSGWIPAESEKAPVNPKEKK